MERTWWLIIYWSVLSMKMAQCLQIWINNIPKKYRTKEEIKQDEQRLLNNLDVSFTILLIHSQRSLYYTSRWYHLCCWLLFWEEGALSCPKNRSSRMWSNNCSRITGFILLFVYWRGVIPCSSRKYDCYWRWPVWLYKDCLPDEEMMKASMSFGQEP